MSFQSAAFVHLAFVALGAFFGSLSCIVCGKLFKKKYFSFRLSLCFLLLAAAIAFFVLFLVNEKRAAPAELSRHLREGALFCAAYFCAGFFCAASLRAFFPIAALLYAAWTLSFGLFLYKKMPLPQRYSLTAGESFVRDEESGAEWKFAPGDGGVYVDFALYELDKNALLPLPRYWRTIVGARPASSKEPAQGQEQAPDVLGAACEAELGQSAGAQKFFASLFCGAAKKLLGKPRVHSVLIPKQQVYPAIFSLEAVSSQKKFRVKVEKIM